MNSYHSPSITDTRCTPKPDSTSSWRWKEECAVFGAIGLKNVARYIALGLHAQQHRGQEAAGILSYHQETNDFYLHRAHGLVGDIFSSDAVFDRLPGSIGIGHNRYSTTRGYDERNLQPFHADLDRGGIGLAHNGNITNADQLRGTMRRNGALFVSDSDSEIILHLIAQGKGDTLERLQWALPQLEGAFSLLVMDNEALYVARDAHGFRPLQIGRLDSAWIAASESCAFDIIGAKWIADVKPGQITRLQGESMTDFSFATNVERQFCLFEYVYFSRPDSKIENRSVYRLRKKMGGILAREHPVDCDIVSPIPDSGVPAALGFATALDLNFDFGLVRNHYVGRTFIEPDQSIRDFGVKLKLTANSDLLRNQNVVLVDDSLVRGTTARKIIDAVKEAGAKEVHLRLSSPPVRFPCFYGIDTPTRSELLASHMDVESIRKYLGATSLGFLSRDGLVEAVESIKGPAGLCDACFTGKYPVLTAAIPTPKRRSRLVLGASRT